MAEYGGRHDSRKEDANQIPQPNAGWIHSGRKPPPQARVVSHDLGGAPFRQGHPNLDLVEMAEPLNQ
jgi:hypothetical protein